MAKVPQGTLKIHRKKNYHLVEMDDAYVKLSPMRKALVQPYKKTLDEIIAEWNGGVYEQNQSHAESLRYDTDGGEVVRSKSEVIIANELYKQELTKYFLAKMPKHTYRAKKNWLIMI